MSDHKMKATVFLYDIFGDKSSLPVRTSHVDTIMRKIKQPCGHSQQCGCCQREGGRKREEGGRGLIYGGCRWFDFRWWANSAIYRSHIIKMYTWNVYDPINQCHLINVIIYINIKNKNREINFSLVQIIFLGLIFTI